VISDSLAASPPTRDFGNVVLPAISKCRNIRIGAPGPAATSEFLAPERAAGIEPATVCIAELLWFKWRRLSNSAGCNAADSKHAGCRCADLGVPRSDNEISWILAVNAPNTRLSVLVI
jgi:hypothetical protein